MNTILPNVTRPCPTWCTQKPGHAWDSVLDIPGTNGLVQRYHELVVARVSVPGVGDDVLVTIEAPEVAPATLQGEEVPDGHSTTVGASLAVHWPDNASPLTVDNADTFQRDLSAAILRGAAALRELQG